MSFAQRFRREQYDLLSAKESMESEDDLDVCDGASPTVRRWQARFDWRKYLTFCGIQFGILLIYTAVLFVTCKRFLPKVSSTTWRNDLLYSPMHDAFQYQARNVDYNFETVNPFKGQPVEKIEEQWDNLINHPHDVLISGSELRKMNRTSIPLDTDPDKYLVQPLTYHMLHCLYNMYRYAHPEFYGVDSQGSEWIVTHTDHCIDNLRQFVQCHASSGMSSFLWLDGKKVPWPVLSSEEVCVDWDRYDGWVREHSLSLKQMATLQTDEGQPLISHPKLGPVTPEDYGRGTEEHDHDMLKL